MTRLSLIDKLGVLINVSKDSSILLIILLVLVASGIGLSFISPKNEKRYKSIYIIIVSMITLLLVISNYSTLGKMFSYMMNNFFIAALFPNFAIYTAAIVVMNIIVWVSVFNYRSARLIRNLNIFVYMVMNYLLALILHVILTNKLDVYSQESIYKNNDARALIELSSTIFIIWIIFLVLYKIILVYLRKDYKPKIKKIIVHKKVKVLPENFQPMTTPKTIYGKAPHNEKIIIKEEVKEKEEKFTLEEYKLFYEILKNQQKKNTKPAKKTKIVVDNKNYNTTSNVEEDNNISQVSQLIENIKQEQVGHVEKTEPLPEIVIDDFFDDVIEEEPVVEETPIIKEAKPVIEEEQQKMEDEGNSISQIIKVDQLIDNLQLEQDYHEKKYDSEPIPEINNMESYRNTQKQEIIKMEEERRELLKQEQLRLEQEKQEKLLEQQRQEEIRQQHLKEMAEKERQQRLLEEQREQELEIERQRQLQEQEERRQREIELQEEEADRLLQQKLEEEEREQEKLTELERLYRSIR